ncbi:MAG TPA: methionyl-tRNA formyltransferase [Acidimicrobiia bacterium]|jgi:methionyl-tRNA formyltransferase|nr:methionyl-tRNA formyltransferase [Acidimicrobiia bacterium]
MRAAFLGTPSAAVPPLAALLDVADVPVVVTRPDAPKGRSGRPAPPPVKLAAAEWGIEVAQPASSKELLTVLRGHALDLGVVVAYGRILGSEALATTRAGFVNLHFSLLPRWRGAAPVERSILAGDAVTGISLMHLDEGMDTGPIISAVETPIEDDETGGTLTARLSYLAGELLSEALPAYMAGALQPAAQISAAATYAARLHTEEGKLDPSQPAEELARRVRGYNPRPGAWLEIAGQRLKVWEAVPVGEAGVATGRIDMVGDDVILGTGDGGLSMRRVQPAGKRPIAALTWMNGRRREPAIVDP